MGLTERIAVIIDSVHEGAVRGLNSVGTAAGTVEPKTKGANVALQLLNRTGLASTQMGQQLTAGINQTGTAMGGLKASGIDMGNVLRVGVAGGALAAGAALTKFALDGVSKVTAMDGAIRKVQGTMGGTAEKASLLRYNAEALGVSSDALNGGLVILAKTIGNGTSKLGEYGIETAKNKDGTVDLYGTLLNIQAGYQGANDSSTKAAIGAAAFGKGYKELRPILTETADQVERFNQAAKDHHAVRTDEDVANSKKLDIATRELHVATTGLQLELAQALVPALTDVAEEAGVLVDALDEVGNAMKDVEAKSEGAPGLFDGIGTIFKKAYYNAGVFSGGLRQLTQDIPGVGRSAGGLVSPMEKYAHHVDEAADSTKRGSDAAKENKKATDEQRISVEALAESEKKAAEEAEARLDSNHAFASSLRDLQDTMTTYTDAVKESTDAGGKNADANKRVDDALFAVQGQTIATAKAAEQYALDSAGKNLSDQQKAQLGHDAYRNSLLQTANSAIPAVAAQALVLIAQLDAVSKPRPPIHVELDISSAEYKIGVLQGKWDSLQNAMGLIGPTRS